MPTNLVLFLVMTLLWGGNWLPMKIAAAEMPPFTLAAIRNILAGATLLALAGSVPWHLLRVWRFHAATAVLVVLGAPALFWALQRLPTGIAAVTSLALVPVFSSVFAAVYGEDRISPARIGAMVLGIFGLVVFFGAKLTVGTLDRDLMLGVAAVLVAAVGTGWGTVVSRPLLKGANPAGFAGLQILVGGLGSLVIAPFVEPFAASLGPQVWTMKFVASLLYMAWLSSLIGWTIFIVLLDRWGPFRVALHSFVTPVFAVIVGVVVLDESFGLAEAAGAAVMFGATLLAMRPVR